jgi:hypothetical protein
VDFIDQLRCGPFFVHGNAISAVVVVDKDERDTVEDRDRRSQRAEDSDKAIKGAGFSPSNLSHLLNQVGSPR